MKTSYSEHAAYWDWDAFEDAAEQSFWYTMSGRYGKKILSAMCALGKTAAYLVRQDCRVTALDLTREMILEGKKRYGALPGLQFVQGDICDFRLTEQDYDFCFIAGTDLHLLPSLDHVRNALRCAQAHLRPGGGLGLGVWYADTMRHSFSVPMRRFEPRVPRSSGPHIWKEGESNFDAETKIQHIHQLIHIDGPHTSKVFIHDIAQQLYARAELLATLDACGFQLAGQYCDYDFHTSGDIFANCYLELRATP